MIVKERKIPISILKLRALLGRLPANHPKIPLIREELSKREAGYKGESSLDYPLTFLSKKDYYIFHDLRLLDNEHYFQIDTLVISQKFILLLEVKNIAGSLFFDHEFNQLIRTKDAEEIAFPDPVVQVKRQESQFRRWLLNNQYINVPLLSFVVIGNPQAIIKTSPNSTEYRSKVIRSEILPAKINQMNTKYSELILSEKEIKKMIKLLKKQHIDPEFPVLEKFHINEAELTKGVKCPECHYIPMTRMHGRWHCELCKKTSKEAHMEAIKDYLCLIDSTISNGKLKDFLKLPSSNTAYRLMKALKLPSEGFNKTKTYHLNDFQNQLVKSKRHDHFI